MIDVPSLGRYHTKAGPGEQGPGSDEFWEDHPDNVAASAAGRQTEVTLPPCLFLGSVGNSLP